MMMMIMIDDDDDYKTSVGKNRSLREKGYRKKCGRNLKT